MLSSATRFTRLSIALVATLAALAGTAGSANAATGNPPCGNKLCLGLTHEPESAFVIPNGYLVYRVTITSAGTATATKVTLTVDLDDRVSLVSAPQGCTPTPTGEISCVLGSIAPEQTPLVRRFLVQVPGTETASGAGLAGTATISGDARRNDKGNNPNDPTDESFSADWAKVAVDRREGQSASALPEDQTLTLDTDVDGKGVARTDTRIARFTLFASDFFTSAAIDDDVPQNNFVCPVLFCTKGGWTQAVIPGPLGQLDPFTGDSSITLIMDVYKDLVPVGLTEANYVLIHDKDYDPATTNYELISARCSATQGPPCLNDVRLLPNGNLHVSAQVTGNWRYR